MRTSGRTALAEAAALELARAARPCHEWHPSRDGVPACGRGPADPEQIAELVEAVFGRRRRPYAGSPIEAA